MIKSEVVLDVVKRFSLEQMVGSGAPTAFVVMVEDDKASIVQTAEDDVGAVVSSLEQLFLTTSSVAAGVSYNGNTACVSPWGVYNVGVDEEIVDALKSLLASKMLSGESYLYKVDLGSGVVGDPQVLEAPESPGVYVKRRVGGEDQVIAIGTDGKAAGFYPSIALIQSRWRRPVLDRDYKVVLDSGAYDPRELLTMAVIAMIEEAKQ